MAEVPLRESHIEFMRRCPVLTARWAMPEGGPAELRLYNEGGPARLTHLCARGPDLKRRYDERHVRATLVTRERPICLATAPRVVEAVVTYHYFPAVQLPAAWCDEQWIYSPASLGPSRMRYNTAMVTQTVPAGASPPPE